MVSSFVACGKKGPPLAPLVKLPVPPGDFAAARRGDTVDLSFTVPSTNTDGTRPANVATAEVYAITAPATPPLSDANLIKFGTRVGSLAVKAPRDPNLTADADDPADEVDAPEGPGLDQGALARVREPLTRAMLTPVAVPADRNAPPAAATVAERTGGPLLAPPPTVAVRTYAVLGASARGRKGPLSRRVVVPLAPAPPPPGGTTIAYDESAITVTWTLPDRAPGAATDRLLPSHAIGAAPRAALTYNVYDSTDAGAPLKLTATPLDGATYTDKRIVWGVKRCYTVVSAETIAETTIESEPPPARCETPVDTFPPAAPADLKAIASEGAINLLWEPNAEKDLAGYLVFRGVEPAQTLTQITPAPIVEPSFKDGVAAGVPYVYAVRAVDKAGNASGLSPRVVETAR